MIEYFDLNKHDHAIKFEVNQAIQNVLEQMHFVGGHFCSNFEDQFARFCGSNYCLGTGNGLDALSIILAGLKFLGKIDATKPILIPENTFLATVLSAHTNDLQVHLYKIKNDFSICKEYLDHLDITRYSAIIYVPLYGNFADAEFIHSFSESNDITLILDAAQAHGARVNNFTAGNLGIASSFSFYPGKNLGCYGDGGAISTCDQDLYNVCKQIRNYGFKEKYFTELIGVNSRLDAIQASILSCKLNYLDTWNTERQKNCISYSTEIQNNRIVTPNISYEKYRHVGHVYAVRVKERERFQQYMFKNGIKTNCHYPIHLRDQKCFRTINDNWIKTHETGSLVSLPCGPELTANDIEKIIQVCNQYT